MTHRMLTYKIIRCSCSNIVRFCCDLEARSLVTATINVCAQYDVNLTVQERKLELQHDYFPSLQEESLR
jgi:hypothetical protein